MKNHFRTFSLSALAIAASLSLAACGGGGGGSGDSTPATTTPTTTSTPSGSGAAITNTTLSGTVTLITPVPSAATGFTETGDVAADSLTFVNYQRAQVGMPAVTANAALATAANNHSLYLYDNDQVGHYETAGLAGYTGNSPEDRIDAAYSSNATGEILIAYQGIKALPSSSQPIQALFEAPFHRAVALYDYAVAGVGYKNSGDTSKVTSMTMDFAGEQNAMQSTQMLASPYNGQTNVETSWYASESPNPFEANTSYENTTVGYPVILTGGLGSTVTVASFTIADAAGNNVPCQEIDATVESDSAGMAVCTPYAQLTPSTSYIVTASGTMTKGGSAQPFNLQWEFTTASSRNTPWDAPSRLSASSTQSSSSSLGGSQTAQVSALAATPATAASAPSMTLVAPNRAKQGS